MDLLNNPWIIALLAFFVGIAGGILLHKLNSSSGSQAEKLKTEKVALQAELDEYKGSVADHFAQTSEMLGNLTENYVKVYQHLAEGSQSLTNTEHPALQLGLSEKQLSASIKQIETPEEASATTKPDDMEAPRDYAPKPNTQDTEGTLSEAFSIKASTQEAHEAEEILHAGDKKPA